MILSRLCHLIRCPVSNSAVHIQGERAKLFFFQVKVFVQALTRASAIVSGMVQRAALRIAPVLMTVLIKVTVFYPTRARVMQDMTALRVTRQQNLMYTLQFLPLHCIMFQCQKMCQ